MKTMGDKELGELYYKSGWCKDEEVQFWKETRHLTVVFFVAESETVFESQKASYHWLLENMVNVSNVSYQRVEEYVTLIKKDIISFLDIAINIDDILSIVSPTTILFMKDGDVGILCECVWDIDNGLAIRIDKNKNIIVGTQDIVF